MKKNTAPNNIRIFGASLLMPNLTGLVQEIDGVREGQDIEYIHRMRVASRRLRSALPLFGPYIAPKTHKKWLKEIRNITRALGEARDADVQIEHIAAFLQPLTPPERAGVRRLLLRLRQQRNRLQPQVLKALKRLEKSGVVESMAQKLAPLDIFKDLIDLKDPQLLIMAREAIDNKLTDFLSYETYIHNPECVAELHAMRIAAKRLRYTTEFFTSLYEDELKPYLKALRVSQELLGSIHDCDVWHEKLPLFIAEERQRTVEYFGHTRPFNRLMPGLEYYRQAREKERQQQYDSFIKQWDAWKQQGLWDKLRSTLELAVQAAAESPAETEFVEEQPSQPMEQPGE